MGLLWWEAGGEFGKLRILGGLSGGSTVLLDWPKGIPVGSAGLLLIPHCEQ